MCGIFAQVSVASLPFDFAAIQRDMRHRGPDAQSGMVFETLDEAPRKTTATETGSARVALYHARLSIIDTRDVGTQPMVSEDGRYTMVYNGEIYNYIELREELRAIGRKFKTETDSEVLLQAWQEWGKACLSKCVGMFAFVLYDRQTRRLTAVRDFFGIKPLYFSHDGGVLRFCSDYETLRIARGVDETLSERETAFYLRFGVTQFSPNSVIEGIQRVGLGEIVEVDAETAQIVSRETYFDAFDIEQQDWSFEEAVEKVRDAFMRSVALHMRSDVPYAATLSGGIDSSAIVCGMRETSDKPVHTFSFHAKTEAISETKWIDIVNARVGAVAHRISIPDDRLIQDLPDLVRKHGEPFGSLSIYAGYKVQQQVAQEGFKVVLSGQGADEIFAGYTHFFGDYAADYVQRGNLLGLRRWLRQVGRNVDGVGTKTILASTAERMLPPGAITMLRKIDRRPLFYPWLNQRRLNSYSRDMAGNKLRQQRPTYLKSALKHHIARGPLSDLLKYEDRNAMAHSIENRVPFLTVELTRLALSMPDDFLISRDGITKHVFREAMRGIVPDEILDRRDKIGFAPDNRQWLGNRSLYELPEGAAHAIEGYVDMDRYIAAVETLDLADRGAADGVWRTRNLIGCLQNGLPVP